MKTKTLFIILIFVLAILIITDSFVSASDTELLFRSVRRDDYFKVKRLIEEGADVNAQNNYGDTALMIASKRGHTEVAKLLIEEGADVNAQDTLGNTALLWASRSGHTDIVKLLIEAGAKYY